MKETNRLKKLKESLAKKEERLDDKFDDYFATVKQANGQPLNDKRGGQATLNAWEKKRQGIRNMKAEVEKTVSAIEREEGKILDVEHANTFIPEEIKALVESGELTQWRKHPYTFFVNGVDRARIVYDPKSKLVAHRYTNELTDKEQRAKFAKIYNSLNAIFNVKPPTITDYTSEKILIKGDTTPFDDALTALGAGEKKDKGWIFPLAKKQAIEAIIGKKEKPEIVAVRQKEVVLPAIAKEVGKEKEAWEMTFGEYFNSKVGYTIGKLEENVAKSLKTIFSNGMNSKQYLEFLRGVTPDNYESKRMMFVSGAKTYQADHIYLVKQALSEGKLVPAEVLAEYPELASPAPAKEVGKKAEDPQKLYFKKVLKMYDNVPSNKDNRTKVDRYTLSFDGYDKDNKEYAEYRKSIEISRKGKFAGWVEDLIPTETTHEEMRNLEYYYVDNPFTPDTYAWQLELLEKRTPKGKVEENEYQLFKDFLLKNMSASPALAKEVGKDNPKFKQIAKDRATRIANLKKQRGV